MELMCTKKYIVIPSSHDAQKKRLLFYIDDVLVYDLLAAIDYDEPEYLFPVNMERFLGKTIRILCDEDIDLHFKETDTPTFDYSGKYRPHAHFTSMRGWLNDPNGLVWADGKYFMYYQHNPTGTKWDNMHWGSAVSADLIHWKEQGDVLFPSEHGTVFSGCGIVDKKNVTGLKSGEHDVILFFYTAAGGTSETSKGQPFTQRLAYTTDNGKTIKHYDKPIIEHIIGENRDPKVIYYAADDSYIMALYLVGHEFALFKSKDLLNWHEIQRITLPDDIECPDFYPLCADGDQSNVKWVFSAAADRYYIGHFDGNHFTPESEQLRLNYGNASYAAQSWSDVPDGRRIRTSFANIVKAGEPYGSCMSIPQEMSLKTVGGELRLCATPVAEIAHLYTKTDLFPKFHIDKEHSFKKKVESKACDICLQFSAESNITFSLFGMDLSYDAAHKRIRCKDKEAPISAENSILSLRVIYDTLYTEIFADNGGVFMGMAHVQDTALNTLTVSSEHASTVSVTVSEMKPFYQK